MFNSRLARWLLIAVVVLIVAILAVAISAESGVKGLAPLRLVRSYPWSLLAEQSHTVNRCVQCHEAKDMHTCSTCHDAHGSIEMAEVPFNNLLVLAGDVPKPGNIRINDILPYRDQSDTRVSLLRFLADQEVKEFESVTLASMDGALVTIEPPNLTDEALLLPHMDGIRFAAENLHISLWLKGVCRITVVGTDKPLRIDGQATSIGRLLAGPTRSVTIEQTDVMLKRADDGEIRKGKTATRIEGAPIETLVANPDFQQLVVRDQKGRQHTLTAEEAQGAVLVQMWGQTVLVPPGAGRGKWVAGVVEIVSQQ